MDKWDVTDEFMGEIHVERRRQIEVEGFNMGHDDAHTDGEMLQAAVIYMWHGTMRAAPMLTSDNRPAGWPWDARWWKPSTRRRNLIKAGALCVAEMERLARRGRSTLHVTQKLNVVLRELMLLGTTITKDSLILVLPVIVVRAGHSRWELTNARGRPLVWGHAEGVVRAIANALNKDLTDGQKEDSGATA